MSAKKETDAGRLELSVYKHIQPLLVGVCDYVKIGSRDTKINQSKMVYCNAPLQFYDLDAIAKTRMRIEIYVKDIKGLKNTLGLSAIRNAIIDKLDGEYIGDSYFAQYSDELSGSDNAGFHYIFMNINITTV